MRRTLADEQVSCPRIECSSVLAYGRSIPAVRNRLSLLYCRLCTWYIGVSTSLQNHLWSHQYSAAGYWREIIRVEVQRDSIDETWIMSVFRYGRWTTIFISVLMVLVCNITSALINDFWIFFGVRLCLGAFSAMCRNSSMVYSKYSQSSTLGMSLFTNLSTVQFSLVWICSSVHFD